MSEPTTNAGRDLLAAFSINERDDDGIVIGHVLRDDPVSAVIAIEAEARDAYWATMQPFVSAAVQYRLAIRLRAEGSIDAAAEARAWAQFDQIVGEYASPPEAAVDGYRGDGILQSGLSIKSFEAGVQAEHEHMRKRLDSESCSNCHYDLSAVAITVGSWRCPRCSRVNGSAQPATDDGEHDAGHPEATE